MGLGPYISQDGGYARCEGYVQGNFYLSRYNADSTNIWRFLLTDFGGNNEISLNCMAYDGLGSAVLAGYKKNPSPNRDDMYFIKISNVGFPVDPLSAKEHVESQKAKGPELVAYPNPCQQYFYLQGLKGKTNLALYNLQGQLLQTYSISPNDAIPAWKLEPGLYVWKAEDGKRVWSGKIAKE